MCATLLSCKVCETTSNQKGVEKRTFACKECQREFPQGNKGLRTATTGKSQKYSRQEVLFISALK